MGSGAKNQDSISNAEVSDRQKLNGTKQQEINVDKRNFFHVALIDLQNFVYFFAPLVFIHLAACSIKPYILDDERGPWEILWNKFIDVFGENKYSLFVWGTVIVTSGFYWMSAALYAIMDFTQKPAFFMKYKIQPTRNIPPDTKRLLKVIATCLFNESMNIPMQMIEYRRWSERSISDIRYVPDVYTTFLQLFICMAIHDTIFYHAHRMLHHKSLYKHIHKKHHEWQAPIAAAATYAHPVEHFLTGVISPGLGVMIMAPQLPVMWLWFCWITFQVQNDHSGYHFPIMFSPEFHDYHHLKFHTSYGWLTFWDWFYGTDIEFQKTEVMKERHFRIHSTQSAREMYPDLKPKSM